ncbi:MAG: hypothetical protein AABW68_01045, partial [archaeon]
MNLHQLRDLALKRRRAVYSTQQLANLLGKPAAIARVYAARLVNSGLAQRMMNGKISFSMDEKVIATQLIEPSYISLYFALLFHQIIQQVPKNVACLTPKTSRKFESLGISYHKISPSLMFGFTSYDSDKTYYWLADPEKALLDTLYLNQITDSWATDIMPNLNRNKVNAGVKRFPPR